MEIKFKVGDRVLLLDSYPATRRPVNGFPSKFGTVRCEAGGVMPGVAWDGLTSGGRSYPTGITVVVRR